MANSTSALPPLLHGNAAQQGVTEVEEEKGGIVRETSTTDTLESALTHSESLPGIFARWKVGGILSEDDRPKQPCTGLWFRIPKWVAGVWAPDKAQTFIHESDYTRCLSTKRPLPPDNAEGLLRVGHNQDLTGQIWHFECIPSVGLEPLKPGKDLVLIPQEAMMQQFMNRVVFKEKFIAFTLEPDTVPAKIKNVEQHEYLVIFSREGDKGMSVDESEKVFDGNGAPLRLLDAKRLCTTNAPFSTTKEEGLITSFEEFLKGNNMSDRVPKPAAAPSPAP